MIRCIVLNQIYFLRKIASQYSFEIPDVCFGIEDVLEAVKESGVIQLDRPKNLECVSLSGSRYLRLRPYSRPCAIERGVLPEACFVFEEDGCPFVVGFFLMLGYS